MKNNYGTWTQQLYFSKPARIIDQVPRSQYHHTAGNTNQQSTCSLTYDAVTTLFNFSSHLLLTYFDTCELVIYECL